MNKFIITSFFILNIFPAFGQVSDQKIQQVVTDFINCVKNEGKAGLANRTTFPLTREYPVPDIKNKQDFIKRYHKIFDDSLINIIVNSDPSKDWQAVGYRGIMFSYGILWLDYDGQLIGVNYESKGEKKERAALVEKEKKCLYPSLKTFTEPVAKIITKHYRIRIDDLGNGNYRYASWPTKNKMSEKPALVLENGQNIPEGSGGNHRFVFKTGDYVYNCEIELLGPDNAPPASLVVYKNGKVVLSEAAISVAN